MESMVLTAEPRSQRGTQKSRRLREKGLIPAVVYGHKEEPEAVTISAESIESALRQHSRNITLQVNGTSQQVVVKELQWDHLGAEVIHVDFQRVSAGERIHVEIPIEFRGEHRPGGVLEQSMRALSLECDALNQPEAIRVDIGHLGIGDSIYVRDLKLPDGVKVLDSPDAVVAHLSLPAGESAEEQTAIAEPERVGGKKPEQDEE